MSDVDAIGDVTRTFRRRSHRALLRALSAAASLALLTTACGGRPATPSELDIHELRALAAENPDDPDIQRDLAIAELLGDDGDASRAKKQIARAISLSPGDPRLLYLSAIEKSHHGAPDDALAGYVKALEAARGQSGRESQALAESAVMSIEDLSSLAPGYVRATKEPLERMLREPGDLHPIIVHEIGDVLIEIAQRRGDVEGTKALAEQLGCVTEARVAGPFGPYELLGFDERHAPLAVGPMADSYDRGPARGPSPTRRHEAVGCNMHLGAPVAEGGTTYAESWFEAVEAGTYLLRVATPNAIEVYVGKKRAARVDPRKVPVPRVTYHPIELASGRHEITIKVSTRHPNPVVSVALVPIDRERLEDAGGELDPNAAIDVDGPLDLYLAATIAMGRGDAVGTRELLREVSRGRGSAALLTIRAAAALSDPLRSPDLRRDDARRVLRAAEKRDPLGWFAPLSLARLDAADGRVLEAIAKLEAVAREHPPIASVSLALTEFLLARGFEAKAAQVVERAAEDMPTVCEVLKAAFAIADRRRLEERADEMAAKLSACDRRSDVMLRRLISKRKWSDASTELARLARFEPVQNRERVLGVELEIARGQGDEKKIDRVLGELGKEHPHSASIPLAEADRLLARGEQAAAKSRLDRALDAEPDEMSELRRVEHAAFGDFALASYRLDGREVIAAYEKSGRTYNAPQVLVLDYTVVRVFDDGSAVELTHNITKLLSQEAVDSQGEVTVPDGARLLTLRTVKADGRLLEPDAINGKESISLPNLAPADYVELEYVRPIEAPAGFPGGYLGDRFYFQSFEVPFDRSELTVILPARMTPIVDPRGKAPTATKTTDGDSQVLSFKVEESRPLTREPMSIPPKEFLPSVQVGARATFEQLFRGVLDVLADRDVADPAAKRAVLRVAAEGSPFERARRLYHWVVEKFDETNDVFGLAPSMMMAKTGSRARILHYAYQLAGLPSTLVLSRSALGDRTEGLLPDEETFADLLVRVELGGRPVYLSTESRGMPFGYLPAAVRDQEAVLLTKGFPKVRTSSADPGGDLRAIDATVQLDESGSARIEVVEINHGLNAIGWRGDLEGIPQAVLEQRFEEHYVARLFSGARLSSLAIEGRDDFEEPLTLRYVIEVPNFGRKSGDRWLVPGLFPTHLSATFATLAERESPLLVSSPLEIDAVLRFRVPEGVAVPAPPSRYDEKLPGGASFVMTAERDERTLTLRRKLRLPLLRVPQDRYAGFARFARLVDRAEARELLVQL